MDKTKKQAVESADTKNSVALDSKTQTSAEEQKNNIPQGKEIAAEENKSVHQVNETQEASEMSVAQIIEKMKEDWKEPETLSKQREDIGKKMVLVGAAINKLRAANKSISSLDRRIKSVESSESTISTDERKLNELKIISLQTELVNLREKNEMLWGRFVAACGSEKAALQFEKLRSQAKSKHYHAVQVIL